MENPAKGAGLSEIWLTLVGGDDVFWVVLYRVFMMARLWIWVCELLRAIRRKVGAVELD